MADLLVTQITVWKRKLAEVLQSEKFLMLNRCYLIFFITSQLIRRYVLHMSMFSGPCKSFDKCSPLNWSYNIRTAWLWEIPKLWHGSNKKFVATCDITLAWRKAIFLNIYNFMFALYLNAGHLQNLTKQSTVHVSFKSRHNRIS